MLPSRKQQPLTLYLTMVYVHFQGKRSSDTPHLRNSLRKLSENRRPASPDADDML